MISVRFRLDMNCVVCGKELHFTWTDHYGVGECAECGTPYNIEGYRNIKETRCALKEEDIPIIKEYWEETKRKMVLGPFMGYTRLQSEQIQVFNEWIEERYPEKVKNR